MSVLRKTDYEPILLDELEKKRKGIK